MLDWETTGAFVGYGYYPRMMLATYFYLQLTVGVFCLFPKLRAEVTSDWKWVVGYWLFPPLLWFRLHYSPISRLLRVVGVNNRWVRATVAGLPATAVSIFLLILVFEFGSISLFFQNDTPDWIGNTNMFWAPFVISALYFCGKLDRSYLCSILAVTAILGAFGLHQFRAYRFFLYWENHLACRMANEMTHAALVKLHPKSKTHRIQIVGEGERTADGAKGTYKITLWADVGEMVSECGWRIRSGEVDATILHSTFTPAPDHETTLY